MKKALILGILGLAAAATQSFGQGNTIFDNYDASPYMPVMYGATHGGLNGTGVASASYHLDLLYFIGTTANPAQLTDLNLSVPIDPTKVDFTVAANHGYIDPQGITIPGYSSGPITFEVEAWQTTGANGGATFAASSDRGTSFLWQESSISAGSNPANFWSGLPGPSGAALLSVNIVPEPSVLALSGIGAAALMLFRRKK